MSYRTLANISSLEKIGSFATRTLAQFGIGGCSSPPTLSTRRPVDRQPLNRHVQRRPTAGCGTRSRR